MLSNRGQLNKLVIYLKNCLVYDMHSILFKHRKSANVTFYCDWPVCCYKKFVVIFFL